MNRFSTINVSQACSQVIRTLRNNRTIFTCHSAFCSKDGSDDRVEDDNSVEKNDAQTKKSEVEKKLNDLLLAMSKISSDSAPNIQIPKPREKGKANYEKRKAELMAQLEKEEKEKFEYRVEEAASNVAKSLGGDVKQTESELLNLYLGRKTAQPHSKKVNSEKTNLSNLLTSMKIEKETEPSRASQVQVYREKRPDRDRAQRIHIKAPLADSINIFGEIPFKFFDNESEKKKLEAPVLSTWDYLYERDLRLSVTHPPTNIFEQLIQWTNEGKLWRFPIDNEQDWQEEADVDFSEHVFLERHIEPWCPKSGPIRHFMELICTGLSKNPYMTVAEKRAHISYYEHYFRSKNALLVELGIPEIPEKSEQIAVE